MESKEHLEIKNEIYAALIKDGFAPSLESYLLNVKPDITVDVNGTKLAIEVQKSQTTIKTILKRMKAHTSEGAHTLWIIPESILNKIIYHKKWVEVIQKIQSGIVFIPEDGKIRPARVDLLLGLKNKYLDKYENTVEISDLIFEKNIEYDLNVVTYKEWWIESYLELAEMVVT